jgi:tetratricopeptide (TPR) repeat protein
MYKEADAARSGRYPQALYALGVAFEELEHHDEAKAAYRNAVAHSAGRERALAHFRLGLLLANESDYGEAATHFSGALIGETSPASHNNLGVMLALSGRLLEAEKEFEAALREAGGAFADAAHNLKQCRTLLKESAKNLSGSLRLVATSNTPGQIDTQ